MTLTRRQTFWQQNHVDGGDGEGGWGHLLLAIEVAGKMVTRQQDDNNAAEKKGTRADSSSKREGHESDQAERKQISLHRIGAANHKRAVK